MVDRTARGSVRVGVLEINCNIVGQGRAQDRKVGVESTV